MELIKGLENDKSGEITKKENRNEETQQIFNLVFVMTKIVYFVMAGPKIIVTYVLSMLTFHEFYLPKHFSTRLNLID